MSNTLGLPIYVLTFLRHMESFKDLLKWSVGENSHKVTLTLSWDFQQEDSQRENLLGKLHKSLSTTQTAATYVSYIPHDILALLDTAPKKNKKTRLKERFTTTLGAIRRSFIPRQSSLDRTHPTRDVIEAHNDGLPYASKRNSSRHPNLARTNSFHGYIDSNSSFAPAMSLPISPAHYSSTNGRGGGGGGLGAHASGLSHRASYFGEPGNTHGNTAGICHSFDELDFRGSGDLSYTTPSSSTYANTDSPTRPPPRPSRGSTGGGLSLWKIGPVPIESRNEGRGGGLGEGMEPGSSSLRLTDCRSEDRLSRHSLEDLLTDTCRTLMIKSGQPVGDGMVGRLREVGQLEYHSSKQGLDWSKVVTGRYDRNNRINKSLSNPGPSLASKRSTPVPTRRNVEDKPAKYHQGQSQTPQPNPKYLPKEQEAWKYSKSNQAPRQTSSLQQKPGTVDKCLDSCDKILTRYETFIN